MSKIDSMYLKELDDRAFRLLQHLYIYNQQRQQIGQNIFDPNEYPKWTYEDFKWELDLHLDNEDEKAILGLGRELERIENRINLVSDVSQFSEPDWIVEGLGVCLSNGRLAVS